MFVVLVFVGTAALTLLAYFDSRVAPETGAGPSPVIAGAVAPPDDLDSGLSRHYFHRGGGSPLAPEVAGVAEDDLAREGDSKERRGSHAQTLPLRGSSRTPGQGTPAAPRARRTELDGAGALPAEGPEGLLGHSIQSHVNLGSGLEQEALDPLTGGPIGLHRAGLERVRGTVVGPRSDRPVWPSMKTPDRIGPTGSLPPKAHRGHGPRVMFAAIERARRHIEAPASGESGRAPVSEGGGFEAPREGDRVASGRFADIKRLRGPEGGELWANPKHPGLLGVLDGHVEPIHALGVSPSGRDYVSASESGLIRHWDPRTGVISQTLPASSSTLLSADWADNWQRFARLGCGQDHCHLDVRDTTSGKSTERLRLERAHVGSVSLSPSAQLAAVGTDDGRVLVSVLGSTFKHSWLAHKGGVWSTAFDPFGRFLATGGTDHLIRLWEPASGRELRQLKGHQGAVQALAFASNGLHLASAGSDGLVLLFRASTGAEIQRFLGHEGPVRAIAFGPLGRRLASAGERTIRIWDIATGRQLQAMDWQFPATAVAFGAQGERLLVGDVEGLVSVWHTPIRSAGLQPRSEKLTRAGSIP